MTGDETRGDPGQGIPDAGAVRRVLSDALAADPGEVSVEPLGGGASRQLFAVTAAAGRGSWVLRRNPPGSWSLVSMATEFEVAAAARAEGVPVPEPVAFEPEGGRLGGEAILMERVEGEAVGPRVLSRPELEAARARLTGELGRALAGIHRTEPPSGVLAPGDGDDPALAQCAMWEEQLDRLGVALPVVEAGLRWMRANAPPATDPVLVHGDFRLGNFLVAPEGLSAVLDWELCHLGDPAEDIGWLCVRSWRFGRDDRPVAGVGSLDELLDAYRAAGGRQVEPERVRYWEAFGNLKWAVICALQAADHMSGARPSMELAALGPRIAEPEWDLLELISSAGEEGPSPALAGSGSPGPLPGHADLLEAVAGYLVGQLRPEAPRPHRFNLLIAGHLSTVVARGIRLGDEPVAADASLFGQLLETRGGAVREGAPGAGAEGGDGSSTERAARLAVDLCAALRAGELDDDLEGVLAALRPHVRRKLQIARPGYDVPG